MTDTDKELARKWAVSVLGVRHTEGWTAAMAAAARYILATLADDRDARIEALTRDVERLTKERDDARRGCEQLAAALTSRITGVKHDDVLRWMRKADAKLTEKPAAEDAEMDAAVLAMSLQHDTTNEWCVKVEQCIELLAARVKEMRR